MGMAMLVTATAVGNMSQGAAPIVALDDRGLRRTERQLQAIGLRRKHETGRHKRARHQ